MKTPEDEAFDELATRQGDWGSGFQTKPWNEEQWRKNNWRCNHGWLRGEQCEICNAAQPPSEWAGIKAILDEYGLQAIDFAADFKAALAQPAQPAQEPYDQTALELCEVCGWKTLIPGDGCLNCERAQPVQEPHEYDWSMLEAAKESLREHMARIKELEAALAQPAQPVQEPVACVQDLDEVKRKHLVYEKGMDWKDPLYTTPPQREWVGLTETERNDLEDYCEMIIGKAAFDAIEAKLKEKNNGT